MGQAVLIRLMQVNIWLCWRRAQHRDNDRCPSALAGEPHNLFSPCVSLAAPLFTMPLPEPRMNAWEQVSLSVPFKNMPGFLAAFHLI